MRAALGDGYVEALRGVWKEVPESADFVMHWWSRATTLVAAGAARSFGLITTNSLRQTFNRRVVQAALDRGVALTFAIPDHPWVDSANGAAVRVAMTVAARSSSRASASPSSYSSSASYSPSLSSPPSVRAEPSPVRAEPVEAIPARLLTVTQETTGEFGEFTVTLLENNGQIHADLSVGANVASARPLQSCQRMTFRGVTLMGSGFWVESNDPLPEIEPTAMKPLRNGRDLTDRPRGVFTIDFFGLTQDQARSRFPAANQRVLDGVKPERDESQRSSYREKWWLFAEARPDMRHALNGIQRYISTPMTAKHRSFQFLTGDLLPDQG